MSVIPEIIDRMILIWFTGLNLSLKSIYGFVSMLILKILNLLPVLMHMWLPKEKLSIL